MNIFPDHTHIYNANVEGCRDGSAKYQIINDVGRATHVIIVVHDGSFMSQRALQRFC